MRCLAGQADGLGEAVHKAALDGHGFVGAEGELELLAGHDGLELAAGDEAVVEEDVRDAGQQRVLAGVGDVGGEEGRLA